MPESSGWRIATSSPFRNGTQRHRLVGACLAPTGERYPYSSERTGTITVSRSAAFSRYFFFLIVSTVVVFGLLFAAATVMNPPVLESLPTWYVLALAMSSPPLLLREGVTRLYSLHPKDHRQVTTKQAISMDMGKKSHA